MALRVTSPVAQLVELKRKPMARAYRPSLFHRQLSFRLSSAAIELVIERAQVLSEGQLEARRYFGSTMLSLDLRRLEDEVSDPISVDTTRRLGVLAEGDPGLIERCRVLALAEAQRLAGRSLESCQIDARVRSRGVHLHIDLDVEATI